MISTIPGIITVAGLLVSYCFVCRHDVATEVHKAWWALFFILLSLTAALRLNLPGLWWYAVPATISIFWMSYLFHGKYTKATYAFIAIFPLNMLGNYFEVDQFKLFYVDLLDILAWTQIGLLWQLRIENPETHETVHSDDIIHQPPILRIVHGPGYQSSPGIREGS